MSYIIWYSGNKDIDGVPLKDDRVGDGVNFYSWLSAPEHNGLGIYESVAKAINGSSNYLHHNFKDGEIIVVTWDTLESNPNAPIGGCRIMKVVKPGTIASVEDATDMIPTEWNPNDSGFGYTLDDLKEDNETVTTEDAYEEGYAHGFEVGYKAAMKEVISHANRKQRTYFNDK